MNNLPLLPPMGGPKICAIVHLYLAVWNDLSAEQKQVVSAHVQQCMNCTSEQQSMNQTTRLVSALSTSSPSARVDQAVIAAIASLGDTHKHARPRIVERPKHRGIHLRLVGLVAAATLLLTVLTTGYFMQANTPQAFALPASLTWSPYVLYYTQTKIDSQGKPYHINSYHDLATGRIHVETVEVGKVDVVMVGNGHETLGMDEMHHVAQRGANEWNVDDSMFDVAQLRNDLQTKNAVYLNKDQFRGQDVYRIRYKDGLVLLLNMQYLPVNVLQEAATASVGEPLYDTLQMMPRSDVAESMWDMNIPAGFRMGTLPTKL